MQQKELYSGDYENFAFRECLLKCKKGTRVQKEGNIILWPQVWPQAFKVKIKVWVVIFLERVEQAVV